MRHSSSLAVALLLIACSQSPNDLGSKPKQRNIRNGAASSDPTVYHSLPFCTATMICSGYRPSGPEGNYKRFAAFLTAHHCPEALVADNGVLAGFDITDQSDVSLSTFSSDKFRVLRGELEGPEDAQHPLRYPFRVIAQSEGVIPSTRTIVGFGHLNDLTQLPIQRIGTSETTSMSEGNDLFESVPGAGGTIICGTDSGGPLFNTDYLTGVAYGIKSSDPNQPCDTAYMSAHMNAVKYRAAIESAARTLVPECDDAGPPPPPCGFTYTYSGTAACTGGVSMGNWRYASQNWPYVTDLSIRPFCRGLNKLDGSVETTAVNRSYVGVTWAAEHGTTPWPCACQGCGFVRAQVAAGVLIYRPGEACGAGCGMPSIQDLGHMNIQVSNRINTPMNPMPMPPGTPLMAQDFDPSKRVEVTVACVPKDANCLVTNRP